MLKSRWTRPVKSSSHSLFKRLSTSCPHPKSHKISSFNHLLTKSSTSLKLPNAQVREETTLRTKKSSMSKLKKDKFKKSPKSSKEATPLSINSWRGKTIQTQER
jgi:hypothetical protein